MPLSRASEYGLDRNHEVQTFLWVRDVLEDFLADPPSRACEATQERARMLLASVKGDMERM